MGKRISSFVGLAFALAAGLAVVGCSAVNSQADAEKAAEVIGLGGKAGNTAYTTGSGSDSLVRDIANRAAKGAKSAGTFTDSDGGTLKIEVEAEEDMPETGETSSAGLYLKFTYAGWHITDSDSQVYEFSGEVYARVSISLVPASVALVLTSSNSSLKGEELNGSVTFDFTFNAGLSGYSYSGDVAGYTVEGSFTID